ncbi:MAG: anti-sigma factor family protein [Myxococcaceae bacterium]
MSVDCEMLGALLSERRRGELSPERAEALEVHLAGCTRCRQQAEALESILSLVELPPVSAAELDALRTRRIAESPPRLPRSGGWRLPAVLVAAAAAAILTVSVRPMPHRHPERLETGAEEAAEVLPAGDSQELFPEMSADGADESTDSADEDALSLEGPGLFGNLDG